MPRSPLDFINHARGTGRDTGFAFVLAGRSTERFNSRVPAETGRATRSLQSAQTHRRSRRTALGAERRCAAAAGAARPTMRRLPARLRLGLKPPSALNPLRRRFPGTAVLAAETPRKELRGASLQSGCPNKFPRAAHLLSARRARFPG